MDEKSFTYKKRVYKKRTTKKRVVKKEVVKKAPRKIIGVIYYAIYVGRHKHISYTGIGRIIPGKEYLIKDRKIADSISLSKNWKVRKSYIYEDITKVEKK